MALTPSISSGSTAPERPNIIFILTDDLGFNQVGANGSSTIRTPNLDRLADNGINFTQAYAGSTVCSPSRVSLFTGRDSLLLRDHSNSVQLEAADITIGHIMKYAGYDTALFGKYSIGSEMGVTDPLAMGFDTWYGMYHILEGHRQYPQFLWRDGVKIRLPENEGGKQGSYAQELFTREAIDYIREERENPFFVFLAYSSPHAELAAPQEYIDPYLETFDDEPYVGLSKGPPGPQYARYYPEPVQHPSATLAGMVAALDDYVGQIYATLEELGIADNTLIFFTSDNGPHAEGGADPIAMKAAAPYKGIKRDLYEGGIHVPMIVHWPEQITEARVDDTPWAFADVLPTLADLTGVDTLAVPRLRSNGVSVAPLLRDNPAELPERILYWVFGKQAGDPNSGIVGTVRKAARKGSWKAVQYGHGNPVELFNLDQDPGEATELSADHPEVHQEFVELFSR
ncbi:MAG: sulfatase-like hydrolase/transferase [Puniceicoccaceae bacterium]